MENNPRNNNRILMLGEGGFPRTHVTVKKKQQQQKIRPSLDMLGYKRNLKKLKENKVCSLIIRDSFMIFLSSGN